MSGQTGEKAKKAGYQALARKWRPRNFSELAGQEAARKTLENSLRQGRLHPVLLFTGPRGTGKTSTARILAKTVRCPHVKGLFPCGKCDSCLMIQEGKSLDVLEIDGASNNGVDAVRGLRETVSYMPSTGSRKIYIIDEAHMLSNSAFNALLKTLEEPPEHVIFIMATTEARKIPQTVLSRCQRLDFHLIPPLLIKQQLETISQAENIPVREDALWLIARQAKGSLRDGQGLLDQMAAFCKGEVTKEKIIDVLGLSDRNIILRALEAVIKRDEALMIEVIRDLRSTGGEAALALQDLIEGLRDLMLLKLNPDNSPPLVQTSRQEIESLKKTGEGASYEDLHFLFDMALKGERELSFSHDSQMVLEVLLLRFAQAPRIEAIAPFPPVLEAPLMSSKTGASSSADPAAEPSAQAEAQGPAPEASAKAGGQGSAPSASAKAGGQVSAAESLAKAGGRERAPKPLSGDAASAKAGNQRPAAESSAKTGDQGPAPAASAKAGGQGGAAPLNKWSEFITFFRSRRPAEAGLMENLSLKSSTDGCFVFAVPEKPAFIRNKCEQPEIRRLIEEHLSAFFKSPKKVLFENSSKSQLTIKEQKAEEDKKSLFALAAGHPFVKDAREALHVRIKSVSRADRPPEPPAN